MSLMLAQYSVLFLTITLTGFYIKLVEKKICIYSWPPNNMGVWETNPLCIKNHHMIIDAPSTKLLIAYYWP